MSEHTTHVAFRSTDYLHEITDSFITRMRNNPSKPEPATIEKIMDAFIQEVLKNFFITPTELTKVPPSTQKVVNFAAETITKASNVVIRSTAKKLDVQQNRDVAEYMDLMRFQKDELWYVAFPLKDTLAAKARDAFNTALEGSSQEAIPKIVDYFHELTDVALVWYFEEPLKLLKFGPILRKVAEVGVATARKVTHSLIDRVIPTLDEEQLKISAKFGLAMLVDGPKRHDA